jgi:hypothetical protein
MAVTLIKHKLTTGGTGTKDYFFLAPKGLYVGALGTACGVSEATDAEQKEPNVAVKELLGCGAAVRIKVRSGTGLTRYTTSLVVAKSKSLTAEAELLDKTINTDGTKASGTTITSVVNPRRATFY